MSKQMTAQEIKDQEQYGEYAEDGMIVLGWEIEETGKLEFDVQIIEWIECIEYPNCTLCGSYLSASEARDLASQLTKELG